MKKLLVVFLMTFAMIGVVSCEAATSGGRGTSTLTVLTEADWSRPGSECIRLKSDNGDFVVYLDGKSVGKLASKKTMKIYLKRNARHSIRVSSLSGIGTLGWHVVDGHKIKSMY